MIGKHLQENKENIAELLNGAGERVGYIINDLLNRELIKQNFRFKDPIVKDDEEIEESKDFDSSPRGNDHQIIDSSKMSRRQYFEFGDAKGIETQLLRNKNIETAFDEEENEMIMPGVDEEDWNKELKRVLKYIDKNTDSQGNVVETTDTTTFSNATYMDELLDRIDKISSYFGTITEFIEGDARRELDSMIDYWSKTNNKISYFEHKFMNDIGGRISEFKGDNHDKTNLEEDAKLRTDRINILIEQYDKIGHSLENVEKEYEKQSKEIFNNEKLDIMRESIKKIKKEISLITIQEGMYRSEVVKYQLKEGGEAFEIYTNAKYKLMDEQNDHQDNGKDDSFEF